MISYFGKISSGEMILSEKGQIAYKIWYELPEHFSFISLDEFVVMPNHIHGIIIIGKPLVQALHATPVQGHATPVRSQFMASISPKRGSLASVIRSYKSAVSKNVHLIDDDFSWHPRYYDHIIRSDKRLQRIRQYIINNPGKWDKTG